MPASLEPTALATYQLHRRAVYAWAFRVLGNHHDAMDVVQDVFLKWVEQVEIVEPASARAWLRTVTVNRAIDMIRSRKRRAAPHDDTPRLAIGDGAGAEREELRRSINVALEALSEQQRAVLIAKVYDDLTFAQIAEELGIAVPTAKTHYLRALATVREALPASWKGTMP